MIFCVGVFLYLILYIFTADHVGGKQRERKCWITSKERPYLPELPEISSFLFLKVTLFFFLRWNSIESFSDFILTLLWELIELKR